MELRFPSVKPAASNPAPKPRPAPGEGMDGDSRDGLRSGVPAPTPATPRPDRSPRRREASRDRGGAKEAEPAPGGGGLSTRDLVAGAENNPFIAAVKAGNGNILQVLGERFVAARALQKAEAWRQLQTDLMMAAQFLCPTIIPLKDLLSAARENEDFVKGSTGQVGRSNEELMEEFLNGGGSLGVTLTLQPPEGLDRDAIIEGGEDPAVEALTAPIPEPEREETGNSPPEG